MIKTISLAAVLFFSVDSTFAQDSTVVSDFEMWTGVSIKKSFLEKKLDLNLTQEFRLDDNSTHLDKFFTELEAKYKWQNGISLGGAYRFIRDNKKNGYVSEYRFNVDLGYKYKFDRLELSSRLRYQNGSELGVTRDEGDYPLSKYRLKLKAEYNIKKWKLDPYFATEVFFTHTTNQINYIETISEPEEKIAGFEKLRFTLGTSYKINDLMTIGGFYRIEKEIKTYPLFYNTPATYFIGGLNLTFKL